LVRSKRVNAVPPIIAAAVVLLFAASCRRPPEGAPAAPASRTEPSVEARVFTLRTTITPAREEIVEQIFVVDRRVRAGGAGDEWRLFDLDARTITFVDDVARSYRTRTLDELMSERQRLVLQPIPSHFPRATFAATPNRRRIEGHDARQFVIRMGGYVRELWMSVEPLIDPLFFRMYVVSEPLAEESAGVSRDVQRALVSISGFPLLETSRMKYGEEELEIERILVKVEQQKVPERVFAIPPEYADESLPTESAADRQGASSPRRGRNARAAE
jgi:hypothetical protein